MKASDLTKTSIVTLNGAPHKVESLQVQTPSARGGSSLYKVRFRNVQNGQKIDQTLRGDDQLEETSFESREVQYLYKSGDNFAFMDLEDYSQFELTAKEISASIPYLVDDMEGIKAIISEGRVLAITMPDTIELEIIECDPSLKGASATSRTKPATLSTGLIVQVPEYISPGETIKVDTRTDVFLSRA